MFQFLLKYPAYKWNFKMLKDKTMILLTLLCTNMITFPELLQRYHQVFNQVVGTDGLEIEMKDKRFVCFI